MKRYYIGSTTDFTKRIEEHNAGQVISTKAYVPWEVIFFKQCETYSEARKVELRLKRYKRRDYIEKIIRAGCV